MKNLPKILYIVAFSLALLLFCYFRVKPLYFQTVPYTYDQGRDFLKAHQIITQLRPALLGPTTGIPGVNHGVWWYYVLTIPFLLFHGNPIGFYYFVFFMALAQMVLFSLFLKKEYGRVASLLFMTPVALSPYFIRISLFAINSVLVLPALLAAMYFFYKHLQQGKTTQLFLIGFFLSCIFEAEVAFGLFFIPAFFLAVLVTGRIKKLLGSKKHFLYFVSGAILPVLPRIAFELKSGFSQTHLTFSYFQQTSVQTAKTYLQVYYERAHLFRDFYLQFFPGTSYLMPIATLIFIAGGLICSIMFLKKNQRYFAIFSFVLFGLLFLISLAYKTVFWQNYFEGLPYFFALFVAFSAAAYLKSNKLMLKLVVVAYAVCILATAANATFTEYKNTASPKLEGLREHKFIADKIYSLAKGQKAVCVMIYTPPIIPYTYDYLFTYLNSEGKPFRGQGFVNQTCYLIIEKDDCRFLPIEVTEMKACLDRPNKWKKINVPKGTTVESTVKINDHVKIEILKNKSL